ARGPGSRGAADPRGGRAREVAGARVVRGEHARSSALHAPSGIPWAHRPGTPPVRRPREDRTVAPGRRDGEDAEESPRPAGRIPRLTSSGRVLSSGARPKPTP